MVEYPCLLHHGLDALFTAFHRHMLTIEPVEDSMHGLNGLLRKHTNRTIPLQQLGHLKDGDVHLGCDRLVRIGTRKPTPKRTCTHHEDDLLMLTQGTCSIGKIKNLFDLME